MNMSRFTVAKARNTCVARTIIEQQARHRNSRRQPVLKYLLLKQILRKEGFVLEATTSLSGGASILSQTICTVVDAVPYGVVRCE